MSAPTLLNLHGFAHRTFGLPWETGSVLFTGSPGGNLLIAAPGVGKRLAIAFLWISCDGTSNYAVEVYLYNFFSTFYIFKGVSHEKQRLLINSPRDPVMVPLGLGGNENYALMFKEATGGTPVAATFRYAIVEDA